MTINATIDSDRRISVNSRKFAGVKGDIANCEIIFDIKSIYSKNDEHQFRIEWLGNSEKYENIIVQPTITFSENIIESATISTTIPASISETGGTAIVYLIEEAIVSDTVTKRICSFPLKLYFQDKKTEESSLVIEEYNNGIMGMYTHTISMACDAEQAKNTAVLAKEKSIEMAGNALNAKEEASKYSTAAGQQADNAKKSAQQAQNSAEQVEDSLSGKVDKIDGKGLSSNDFTNDLKDLYDNYSINKQDALLFSDGLLYDRDRRILQVDTSTIATKSEIELKESTANKTLAISSESTNEQYPSAKAVYDNVKDKATISYVDNAVSNVIQPLNSIEQLIEYGAILNPLTIEPMSNYEPELVPYIKFSDSSLDFDAYNNQLSDGNEYVNVMKCRIKHLVVGCNIPGNYTIELCNYGIDTNGNNAEKSFAYLYLENGNNSAGGFLDSASDNISISIDPSATDYMIMPIWKYTLLKCVHLTVSCPSITFSSNISSNFGGCLNDLEISGDGYYVAKGLIATISDPTYNIRVTVNGVEQCIWNPSESGNTLDCSEFSEDNSEILFEVVQ